MYSASDNADLYVLAGGRSSRFGSDKALADVEGVPMLCDVIDRLTTDRHRVTLVTGSEKQYESFGYPTITDEPVGVGPIGGLRAALSHRLTQFGTGWLLLASCDLVQPRRAWASRLARCALSKETTAIAYQGEHWEPMLAMYHTRLLTLVDEQINQKRYSMQSLLDTANAHSVELPRGYDSLPQANTPEQLAAGRKLHVA